MFENGNYDPSDPERITAVKIIDYIKTIEGFTEEDFKEIESLYNVITTTDHYNGSAWHDFKIRLTFFLAKFSKKASLDKTTGTLTIH